MSASAHDGAGPHVNVRNCNLFDDSDAWWRYDGHDRGNTEALRPAGARVRTGVDRRHRAMRNITFSSA